MLDPRELTAEQLACLRAAYRGSKSDDAVADFPIQLPPHQALIEIARGIDPAEADRVACQALLEIRDDPGIGPASRTELEAFLRERGWPPEGRLILRFGLMEGIANVQIRRAASAPRNVPRSEIRTKDGFVRISRCLEGSGLQRIDIHLLDLDARFLQRLQAVSGSVTTSPPPSVNDRDDPKSDERIAAFDSGRAVLPPDSRVRLSSPHWDKPLEKDLRPDAKGAAATFLLTAEQCEQLRDDPEIEIVFPGV
jgi:hypothetical protein